MITTVHYVSLLVYLCVLLQAVADLSLLRKCKHVRDGLRVVISMFLVCVVAQAMALLYLQLTDFPRPLDRSLAWLAVNLFNGLALFIYVSALQVFLEWKGNYVSKLKCIEVKNGNFS